MFYKFLRLRLLVSTKLLLIIYHALIQSILQYSILVWGNAHYNLIKRVEIVQKSILKIILKKKRRFSTILLFKEAQVLDINRLYIKQVLILAFKTPFPSTRAIHQHNTRQEYAHQRVRTSASQRLPEYTCWNYYEKVPNEIKMQPLKLYIRGISDWLLRDNAL